MLKFLPLVLAVAYAVLMLRFSVWRTKQMLDAKSQP
jgi:metalloprotease